MAGQEGAALVGVAGAVTTIAAVAASLTHKDIGNLHHFTLSATTIQAVTESLCAMNHAQRSAITAIHPGRVDVIMGGALILTEVMRQTRADELIVSERDLLDGVAASMAEA